MRRQSDYLCAWLVVGAVFLVGCGGGDAGKPSSKTSATVAQADTKSAAAPAQTGKNKSQDDSATQSSVTAADKQASATDASTETKSSAKSAHGKSDSRADAKTNDSPAGKSTSKKSSPADKPEASKDGASAAANTDDQASSPRPAATAAQITKVIDLQTLPRLEVKQVLDDQPGHVYYSAKATVAAAEAFYTAELASRGWQAVEGGTESTDQYADRDFEKDGCVLRVSIGASGDEGQVGIGLSNIGNVDVRTLPRPPNAEAMGTPTLRNVTYRTSAGMADAVKFCREQLPAAGWQEYTQMNVPDISVPHYKGLSFMNHGLRLMVSISRDEKNPAVPVAVSYLAHDCLPHDLPVAKGATGLEIEGYQCSEAQYASNENVADLVAFYETAAAELGWHVRPKESRIEKDTATLYLEDDAKLGLAVYISHDKDKSSVKLTRMSFAEESVAKTDSPDAVQDLPDPVDLAATERDSEPDVEPAPEPEPDEQESVSAAIRKVRAQIGEEANAELKKARKQIKELGEDVPKDVLDKLDELLGEEDEDVKKEEAETAGGQPGEKDEDEDEDDEEEDDEDEDEEDEEEEDEDDDREAGDKEEETPEYLTNFGEVDLEAIEKNGTKCVVTLEGKTFEFKHVLAVYNKPFDTWAPVLLFSSKPFSKTKLARALRGTEDISTFEVGESFTDSMELRLSDSAAGVNAYVDNTSISITSSDIVQGFKVDGNRLKGQAKLVDYDFFDKPFSFEATFDLDVQQRSAKPAASGAGDEIERNARYDVPLPAGDGASEQRTNFRSVLNTKVRAPIAKVAEFYDRETALEGWKKSDKAPAGKAGVTILAYQKPGESLTVTLSEEGDETSVEAVVTNEKMAREQGMLPAAGKAKLVLGNASETEVVFTIAGKDYKLAAGAGAEDPSKATKIDVKPGKITISIKPKGGKKKTMEVDIPAGSAWGLIAVPGGEVFDDRLF